MSNDVIKQIMPLTDKHQALVFSDLDGTLLDHYSYSFEEAEQTIEALKRYQIPLVLNTSKTFDEVLAIQDEMQIHGPFVVENGAAIYIPKSFFPEKPKGTTWRNGFWMKSFTHKRQHWQNILKKLNVDFEGCFEMFSEMPIERIIELTGLDQQSAINASKREFGEPLYWHANEELKKQLINSATNLGASPLQGGRFLHIGGNTNKGKVLSWLCNEFERQNQGQVTTSIALGDGNNDIAMLEAADVSVRITSPVNPPPILQKTKLVYTSPVDGPKGWSQVLNQLIPILQIR
ncbi:HAD-IIB family hydrolase [Glaciecola petra]|uniref:HAD-IIB family hydrolase n=1 Tax=Glaciecola petra TaxID=3075602 RepID=A0ABU2ZNW3_9ALTE|nr:HAD-IIB family hydrolase [Aestuariibacter sp. P117]MDT0594313.1 HAD-IIB family hydrolase [Aestuariibacter sp. P117]